MVIKKKEAKKEDKICCSRCLNCVFFTSNFLNTFFWSIINNILETELVIMFDLKIWRWIEVLQILGSSI